MARQYAPPAVLVSASFEPLHFFGRAQRYFALPGDEADFSVFSLCLPELRNELKALCYRMVQEGVDCLAGVSVSLRLDEGLERIRPVLRRVVLAEENGDTAYLICFEPEPAAALPARSDVPEPEARADELVRLRQELADTREHLQLVIEELEASNEELQSLNEELQSSGEELQSSNEELQSSNEELTTLNDELRAKSLEASQLSATLGNIQNSIRTSLVVWTGTAASPASTPWPRASSAWWRATWASCCTACPATWICPHCAPRWRTWWPAARRWWNGCSARFSLPDADRPLPQRAERIRRGGAHLCRHSDLYRAEQAQLSSEGALPSGLAGKPGRPAGGGWQGRHRARQSGAGGHVWLRRGELIGQSVEVLVPEALRAAATATSAPDSPTASGRTATRGCCATCAGAARTAATSMWKSA